MANVTSFAQECRDAMTAVLDALGTVGPERREHLAAAKFAVAKALHEAHTAEDWSLADHLRRAVKDVEIHPRDAA